MTTQTEPTTADIERALAPYDDGATGKMLADELGCEPRAVGGPLSTLVQSGQVVRTGERVKQGQNLKPLYRLTDEVRLRYGFGPLVPTPEELAAAAQEDADAERAEVVRGWDASIAEALRLAEGVLADWQDGEQHNGAERLANAVAALYDVQAARS